MRTSHIIGALLAIFVLWASLFFTVLTQSAQTRQLLKNDHTLLSQDTVILNAQKKTESDLEKKIADLQNHIDCIVALFQQSNRTNLVISDIESCQITSSGQITSTATTINQPPVSQPPVTPTASQSTNTSHKQATAAVKPKPVKSTVCKLTLGILGC